MFSERQYGCVFCRTGREYDVVTHLSHIADNVNAVVPAKIRYRRSHGLATEERVVLFPGYVFFESSSDLNIREKIFQKDIYRILTNTDGDWRLQGIDKEVARQFISIGGTVALSKAYYDGDRIRIIDGFLKQYEGKIVRVNHRAKTAQIIVPLDGKQFSLWVGFEVITKCDDKEVLLGGCKTTDRFGK